MDKCVTCSRPGDLICFCSKEVFCSSCIGNHLVAGSAASHKPVRLSESHFANLLSESWHKLQASEERILADAQQKIDWQAAAKQRLRQELLELKQFRSLALKSLSDLIAAAKEQLKAAAASFSERVKATCAAASKQLKEALEALDTDDVQFNDLADFLTSVQSTEELHGLKLTQRSLDVRDLNIEDVLKGCLAITVSVLEPKKPQNLIRAFKTTPFILSDLLTEPALPLESPRSRLSYRTAKKSKLTPDTHRAFAKDVRANQSYRAYTPNKHALSIDFSCPAAPDSGAEQRLYWVGNGVLYEHDFSVADRCAVPLPRPEIGLKGSAWARGPDGNLYLTGGQSTTPRNCAWVYHTDSREFSMLPSMRVPRLNHAAITYGEYIYVLGGFNRIPIKDCERFDLTKRAWEPISNLNTSRDCHTAVVHRGRLYVAGGTRCDSIEAYNQLCNKFTVLRVKLSGPGKSLGFSFRGKILILHNKKLSELDVQKLTATEVSALGQHLWSPGNSITIGVNAFFVCEGLIYKLDMEGYAVSPLFPISNE